MNIDVILGAPVAVQVHVAAAVPALVLGPVALWRRRRDGLHRAAGRAWVVAMLVLAGSSFLIHEARQVGPFSVIHLLSVLTIAGLWQGVRAIRRGDVAAHGRAMRAIYMQALILAGVFTLLPGRRMSLLLFPDAAWAGFALVAGLGAAGVVLIWREGRRTAGNRPEP